MASFQYKTQLLGCPHGADANRCTVKLRFSFDLSALAAIIREPPIISGTQIYMEQKALHFNNKRHKEAGMENGQKKNVH